MRVTIRVVLFEIIQERKLEEAENGPARSTFRFKEVMGRKTACGDHVAMPERKSIDGPIGEP